MEDYVAELRHIKKQIAGIVAANDITLRLKRGEIHAILGENGSGKSTIAGILSGLIIPDEGEILKDGQKIDIRGPKDSHEHGIGVISQNFNLIEEFTGLQNIILGQEPLNKIGFVRPNDAEEEILKLCNKYNFLVDINLKISEMTIDMKQEIEILKLLYRKDDVIVFDEPTTVLSPLGKEEFLGLMSNLSKEGFSIVFITNSPDEVDVIADRCTILREGDFVGMVDMKRTNLSELKKILYGEDIEIDNANKTIHIPGETVMSVRNLTVSSDTNAQKVVSNVSFDCKRSEITYVVGIVGNGQTALINAISGLVEIESGSIKLKNVDKSKMNRKRTSKDGFAHLGNVDITDYSVRERNLAGVSFVPKDIDNIGLFLDFSVKTNLMSQRYFEAGFSRAGWLLSKHVNEYANKIVKDFNIDIKGHLTTPIKNLSKDNRQKIVLAREFERDATIIICDEPTNKLNLKDRELIQRKIMELSQQKKSVLVVSYDLDEALTVADRIFVMCKGQIVASIRPDSVTKEELSEYMNGSKQMENMHLYDADPEDEIKRPESEIVKKIKGVTAAKGKVIDDKVGSEVLPAKRVTVNMVALSDIDERDIVKKIYVRTADGKRILKRVVVKKPLDKKVIVKKTKKIIYKTRADSSNVTPKNVTEGIYNEVKAPAHNAKSNTPEVGSNAVSKNERTPEELRRIRLSNLKQFQNKEVK